MTSGNIVQKKSRSAGLDLVRVCAISLVIGGHFFLHTSFNKTAFGGWDMTLLSMFQTLSLINVPLFLTLTGYLNLNKKVSRNYFIGGLRVIVTYLMIAIITGLFRIYYMRQPIGAVEFFLKITDFSIIPYGWYIEMWIGLFLITPFLNILWHAIESKRHRILLIVILSLLTALPDFFNRYGVSLMPGYWLSIYPITFFYIGAYMRTYQPQYSKLRLWLLVIGLCAINPLANLAVGIFLSRPMLHVIGSGHGIIGIPLTAVFFMALYKIDTTQKTISCILAKISLLSLDMYLVSYMADVVVYRHICQLLDHGAATQWVVIFLIAVPASILLSFLGATITHPLCRFITKVITEIRH